MSATTWRLIASMGLMNLGFWLLWPAGIVRVEALGWGEALAGLFASATWVACLAGLLLVSRLVGKLGFRRTTFLSGALLLLATAGTAYAHTSAMKWAWALLLGFAVGLRWTAIDAWLADSARPAVRGRVLALNETAAGVTMVLGPALAAVAGSVHVLPLTAAAGACTLAGLLICATVPEPSVRAAPRAVRGMPAGIPGVALAVVLAAAYFGGVFEIGFMAAAPLIAWAGGLSEREALAAAATVGLGSFATQYLLGLWADRIGGRGVLIGCALSLAAALAVLAAWPAGLLPLSLVIGGVAGGLYTVAVIYGVQATSGSATALISAVALAYTIGTLVSPAATGIALETFGIPATVAGMAGSSLLLALVLVVVRDAKWAGRAES